METGFEDIATLLVRQARRSPGAPALTCAGESVTCAELGERVERIAGGLARDIRRGEPVALLAELSIAHVAALLGVLRAGGCVVPLPGPPAFTDAARARMIADCGARVVLERADLTGLDGPAPAMAALEPDAPCNIIYSSGTTGQPKGIVQSHRMRWHQVRRMGRLGLEAGARVLVATPLWSNTTLITLLPTLCRGGHAVLLPRFDEAAFLELARREAVTHTMLVPVQYQRILGHPAFERADLKGFRRKLCTGAPLAPSTKRELLERWPGDLIEIYGQTEGGPTTVLDAARHPDKLSSVGRPADGVELRVIDPAGRELPVGEAGEVVGRAASMMLGYHNRPELTGALTWRDAGGRAFYRSGDIGRLDADGFLHLLGRAKDVIISGGQNVHAVDLEQALGEHEGVAEVAVIGVPDPRWGERPLAVVVPRPGVALEATALAAWANARLAPAQRLCGVALVAELPRGPTGKVLKTELRRLVGAS